MLLFGEDTINKRIEDEVAKQVLKARWEERSGPMDVSKRMEVRELINESTRHLRHQVDLLTGVVADQHDEIEELKLEIRLLRHDTVEERSLDLSSVIKDKVTNKKLQDELITKLYQLEDAMPRAGAQYRLAPKDNPLRPTPDA